MWFIFCSRGVVLEHLLINWRRMGCLRSLCCILVLKLEVSYIAFTIVIAYRYIIHKNILNFNKVALLRGIILYQEQLWKNHIQQNLQDNNNIDTNLPFRCRKSKYDFIYQSEWNNLLQTNTHFKLHTVFSQDNLEITKVKTYV